MFVICGYKSSRKIIGEIRAAGRVTFARYMELALYHPEEGYYMRDREIIGPTGDFYTSPDVSPLFGRALADQMEEMWRLSGSPDRWVLLEFGAGKGILARDILNHGAERHRDFFHALTYLIIERSPHMIRRQQRLLSGVPAPGGGVRWISDIEEQGTGGLCGCLFSNELLDAFPVHRVVKCRGEIREIYVACKDGGLLEELGGPSGREILDYLEDFRVGLEEGQAIEINLAMRGWVTKAARALGKGFLLTIDYGDTAGRVHSPARPAGTIRSYRRHRLVDNLYESPGQQDITSHVNFSALIRWGGEAGLDDAGFTSQSHFLLNLGILDFLDPRRPGDGFDLQHMKDTMAVKKLIMPEGMGSVFKVAAQCKGFDRKVDLTGFRGKTTCRR